MIPSRGIGSGRAEVLVLGSNGLNACAMRNPVRLSDAHGLSLSDALGADKVIGVGLGPSGTGVPCIQSGVAGGIDRDVRVATVPGVQQRKLNAVAALVGELVAVLGHVLWLPGTPTAVAGAVACFLLRRVAIGRGWRLPLPRSGGSTCASVDRATRTAASGRLRASHGPQPSRYSTPSGWCVRAMQ